MIKLYGFGLTRWFKPYWTLKELNVPFEEVPIRIGKGENRDPKFLAISPFGKLPVMEDDGFVLLESAAICTYLADKYGDRGLVPKPGTRDRARYDQWMAFTVADLEQPLWRLTRHVRVLPEARRSPAELALAKEDFATVAKTLESQIGDYLVGDRFSVADIAMTYTLRWAELYDGLLKPFPKLIDYAAKHSARPAFPKHLFG